MQGFRPNTPQRPVGLFDLHGIGFSRPGTPCVRPEVPTVTIIADGRTLSIPREPVRCSNANGLTDQIRYQVYGPLRDNSSLEVSPSDPSMKVEVSPIVQGRATVTCTWKGLKKIYLIN